MRNIFKKPILLIPLLMVSLFAFSQISGSTVDVSGLEQLTTDGNIFTDNLGIWISLASILLVLVARIIPTSKSLDVITWIVQILDFVVPNKSSKKIDGEKQVYKYMRQIKRKNKK